MSWKLSNTVDGSFWEILHSAMSLDQFCSNFLNVEALAKGNDILKNRDQSPFLTMGVLKKVFVVDIYSNDS